MMRIGLDIDDVLFPWSDAAHAACDAVGITGGHQVTTWKAYESYGCDPQVYWDTINDAYRAGMLLGDAYPDTVVLLDRARANGHTVHLVTARGFDGPLVPLVRAHTMEWASAIPHDSLTLSKDKSIVLVDAFLDDSVANVAGLQRRGITCYLRVQAHNATDTAVNECWRVSNLQGFLDRIGAL